MSLRSRHATWLAVGVLFFSLGTTADLQVRLGLATADSPTGAGVDARAVQTGRVQALVEDVRFLLALPQEVRVSLVSEDRHVASVGRLASHPDVFVLSVEAAFLDDLTDDEAQAVVAHELGHVWIFTHHPFLQTEELANEIAMRAVARDSLERVYEKVWRRVGRKGDLTYFHD